MRRAASELYVPDQHIPGFVRNATVWLDASRITGLADGAAVTTWSDLSGNGNDATQATEANKPLYKTAILAGKPVVRFDGLNSIIQTAAFGAALNQPSTIILVTKLTTAGGGVDKVILDGLATGRHTIYQDNTANDWSYFAGTQVFSGTATDTNWHIISATFNGASSILRKDGASIATSNVGAQTLTGLTLGAVNDGNSKADCDIAEVIVVNQALTAGELNRAHLYLGRKWGIGVS